MRPEHWLFTIPLRLRSLFSRAHAGQELNDELCDHLERATEEYVAKGMTPEEARRLARFDLGGIEQTKEKCRDARRVNWIQDLAQDLRYGLRMLRKSPGFTAVAVLWYAAYGSNVCQDRFLCYIRGGTPARSKRNYVGCIDDSLPRDARPITIPHRLFFAGSARGWSDIGMAFVRSARGGRTLGRMYLITFSQFDQLIQQEQGAEKPSDTRICPPLSFITANEFCFTNPADPMKPADGPGHCVMRGF